MHGKADRLDPSSVGSVRVERRNVRVVDAELVAPPAGGDLVVGLGIDVRVDAERDRRAGAGGAGGRVESLKLGRGLDVELPDPGCEREVHLVPRLARPGEHQAIRRDAGPECAPQLAARDDVGAGAEPGEGADHREGVVGLDRVADERVGRSLGKRLVAGDEDRVRVAIGGRAELRRDCGERDSLGVKNAAAVLLPIGECVHVRHPSGLIRCRSGGGHCVSLGWRGLERRLSAATRERHDQADRRDDRHQKAELAYHVIRPSERPRHPGRGAPL